MPTTAERVAPHDVSFGLRTRLVEVLRAIAVIRRLEFYVVELTILSIPLLIVAHSASDLTSATVLEGAAMFFVLYAFGDMINCVADRDLDSEYKSRLSRGVYRLGVRRVKALVAVEGVVGVALAAHLAATTDRWLILGLVLVGVFLGAQYSVGPLHLKGRGLGHLVCLWLLLYFLPMLCASLLLVDALGIAVVAMAAAYATLEMGIILVNTSEDLPEDRAAGVRTTTVALGLRRTLVLAMAMVVAGGLAFCGLWAGLYVDRGVGAAGYAGLVVLVAACILVGTRLLRLTRSVLREDEHSAIAHVKAAGPLVPIGATLVGWTGVVCGGILLGAGGG